MELRQLQYLVALADERSFTRAAQQTNVAQPALSRQIQKLERELGVPLVDRTSRRVTLTAAGREVVELRADRFDLAQISGIPDADRQGLELLCLAKDELRVLLPGGHPLADHAEIRVADLRGERFLSFPPGATIRNAVAAAAKDAGYVPDVAFEISDVGRTGALVAQGLGVAVVPAPRRAADRRGQRDCLDRAAPTA
jgi:DNA-binding transcriptional LysR family regulator